MNLHTLFITLQRSVWLIIGMNDDLTPVPGYIAVIEAIKEANPEFEYEDYYKELFERKRG